MDLLGHYDSDSDTEQSSGGGAAAAAAAVGQLAASTDAATAAAPSASFVRPSASSLQVESAAPLHLPVPLATQPTGTPFSLAALLPPAQSTAAGGSADGEDAASRKRRKEAKRDKREKKRQKGERVAEEAAAAASSAALAPPPPPAPIVAASASSFGLGSLLPPPKFASGPPAKPSFRESNPFPKPALAAPHTDANGPAAATPAAAAAAVSPAPAVPAPSAPRPPPGMRAPPGMKGPSAAAAATATAAAAASPAAAAAASSPAADAAADAPASYEDALAAAAALSAGAPSDDAVQEQINAELALNPHLLDDDDDGQPYVPLYAREAQQKPQGVKDANFSAQLGNLTGQDKYFKRALGSEINFLSVNQKDLTHRSMSEELQARFEDQNPHAAGQVKVDAKFWNSRTGAEESQTELSTVHKRKHQINQLAVNAAAMEIELARQRQAGYAKRDTARKKYGW